MAVTVLPISNFCQAVASQCQKSGQSPDWNQTYQNCMSQLPSMSPMMGNIGRLGYNLEMLPVRGAVKIFSEFHWGRAKTTTERALLNFCDKFPPPPPAPATEPNVVPAEELGYTPLPQQFIPIRSLASSSAEDVAVEQPVIPANDEEIARAAKEAAEAAREAIENARYRYRSPWPQHQGDWAFSPSDGVVVPTAAALGGLLWFANKAWNLTESTVSAGLNMMAISISPLQQYIIDESDLSSAPQS